MLISSSVINQKKQPLPENTKAATATTVQVFLEADSVFIP